jgi:hypothetical protein
MICATSLIGFLRPPSIALSQVRGTAISRGRLERDARSDKFTWRSSLLQLINLDMVSRLQVQQLIQIYTITKCCLSLSALGSLNTRTGRTRGSVDRCIHSRGRSKYSDARVSIL